MHVEVPDPHPGRCRNTRTAWRGAQVIHLRCLDYEGTRHVCEFPHLAPAVSSGSSWSTAYAPKPQPWVRPDQGDQTDG